MKKKELRIKYKQRRSEFSRSELDTISQKIIATLFENFDLTNKKISVFIPISRFNEINTWQIIDSVTADFCLPVIDENDELKQIHYEGKHQLKQNSWGILEPIFGSVVDPSELDIVLVPLLTIDQNGFRVGYGKGYYDRFLKRCKPDCTFIGLYQFNEIEVIEDLHESDIKLHYCVMPNGLLQF